MKKILSMLLAVCMLGAFTASAAFPTGYSIDVVETKDAATVDIAIEGAYTALSGFQVMLQYDTAKLQYASKVEETTFTSQLINWSDMTNASWNTGVVLYAWGEGKGIKENYISGDKGLKIGTLTFNKIGDATLEDGDIRVIASNKKGMSTKPTQIKADNTTKKFSELTINASFTAYVPAEPEKPVISLDPSNPTTGVNNGVVDIVKNDETGAYSVKVKAPIGKKAVIYLNGEAQTGSEISGTATADTTIKVEYVDVADEVITYVVPMSNIYGAEETGIAAFGKGTIAEGVAYGIKFGGLTGTYKDITDYKFPAKGNVGGIFGVEVKDAPAGAYTAQAYVGDTMGAAISFTK